MRVHWLRATALALALPLGCSDECNDLGCGASLIVELAPESEAFEDGEYEVTLELPGLEPTACTFTIEGGAASALECAGDEYLRESELPRYMLVFSYEQPETLTVTVRRDGTELVTADFSPEYEALEPGAKACGVCSAGQVSVTF